MTIAIKVYLKNTAQNWFNLVIEIIREEEVEESDVDRNLSLESTCAQSCSYFSQWSLERVSQQSMVISWSSIVHKVTLWFDIVHNVTFWFDTIHKVTLSSQFVVV